ncbi:MAG: hypothetical protein M5U28_23145 [Sandaracinaceae bacterium]|nr:hypothetical protein [Sandaracinaceae bacterium]
MIGDCFETFPFPEADPRAVIPGVEEIGQRLYDARATYLLKTQQGLTQTYNRLKDPACHDEPILELRRLHEEMDRAVLAAYGWTDLEVPLLPHDGRRAPSPRDLPRRSHRPPLRPQRRPRGRRDRA